MGSTAAGTPATLSPRKLVQQGLEGKEGSAAARTAEARIRAVEDHPPLGRHPRRRLRGGGEVGAKLQAGTRRRRAGHREHRPLRLAGHPRAGLSLGTQRRMGAPLGEPALVVLAQLTVTGGARERMVEPGAYEGGRVARIGKGALPGEAREL